jgi:MHS family proline/betaine transporter-like MFS transporter
MSQRQTYRHFLLVSIIGNALIFYNFTLYGVLAVKLGQVFFPWTDAFESLMASLGVFAAGFVMRPLGALLFGHIGDKYGRKIALGITVIGMGFSTVVIAVIPGYDQIGITAPLVVIASRLVQGLFAGGEYSGVAVYCLEKLDNKMPGFYSGFLTSSCVIGSIIATIVGGYFVRQEWTDAWRIPFVIGYFISFLGIWLRYKIEESPQFIANIANAPISIFTLLTEWRLASLKTFSVGALNGLLSYTLFGFLTIFIYNYSELPQYTNIIYTNMVGLVFFMLCSPFMGYLYDKFGEKLYLKIMLILLSILPSLGFYYLSSTWISYVIIGEAILGLCASAIGGVTHIMLQGLFPTLIRYRGIAFNFNMGMAVVGGTVGMMHLYLIEKTGSIYAPSIYIFIVAVLVYCLFNYDTEKSDNTKSVNF